MTTFADSAARPTSGGPWDFHPHSAAWAGLAVLAALLVLVESGVLPGDGTRATRRQWTFALGGVAALACATTWPIADLAAKWSLTALLFQRLLLTLAVAPLLLLAVPTPVLARLTRPAVVDAVVEFFTRPLVAVVTFTLVAVGTLSGPAVAAQASSAWARAGIDLLLIVAGALLWGPVLRHVPGSYRPSPVGTAVYLFVQSIVPTFPAVIYIFARHPLYHVFAAAHGAMGISSVADQQLAGVVAKVATLPVLWTVAWVELSRGQLAEERAADPYPLTWADVERQLERAERAERRPHRHRSRPRAIPRPMAGAWSDLSKSEVHPEPENGDGRPSV